LALFHTWGTPTIARLFRFQSVAGAAARAVLPLAKAQCFNAARKKEAPRKGPVDYCVC
jgi:hypothetical protein